MLMQLIASTGIQWIIFMMIPVISYWVYFRKRGFTFATLLGFKKSEPDSKEELNRLLIITTVVVLAFWGYSYLMLKKYQVGNDDIRFLSYLESGWSLQTILIILIQSILQTSFLEELIFRGFLINAFRKKFSFNLANQVQALIFAGIHVLGLMQMQTGPVDMVMNTIIIYVMSLLFGKLAKASNYSILYSAIFHGASNLLAALMLILVK